MKNLLCLFFLIITIGNCFGQDPNWSINPSNYQHSMTFTVFLNVNGTTLSSTNDKVAAFIDGEVSGVANVVYEPNSNKYVAYLTVFSNANLKPISFKIYDSANNSVVNVSRTINFKIDGNEGSIFQGFSLANPALNKQANITVFSFKGVVEKSINIATNTIDVVLPQATNVSNLIADFSLSNGAKGFVNRVVQTSGNTTQNYTNSLIFKVLSEDESILKEYTINVSLDIIIPDLDVNLSSNSNYEITENGVAIQLTISEEVLSVDFEDFELINAALLSIVKSNTTTYNLILIALSQGDLSIQIPENNIITPVNKGNKTSNKLTFSYDSKHPYVVSLLRKEPLTLYTNSNTLIFDITFNEAVKNVNVTDFETVAGANLTLQKVDNTNYTITVSNLENFEGKVSVGLKSTNTITDFFGNRLRTSIIKNY